MPLITNGQPVFSVTIHTLDVFVKKVDWYIGWLTYWIRNWYIATHLDYTSRWDNLFKKPPSFQIGSGWNLAGLIFKLICIDWQSRISDVTSYFEHGGHDVILCRKVLPSSECTCSWYCLHPLLYLKQCLPATGKQFCLLFLINITFVV